MEWKQKQVHHFLNKTAEIKIHCRFIASIKAMFSCNLGAMFVGHLALVHCAVN